MRRFLRPGLNGARPVEDIRRSVDRFSLLSRTPKDILISDCRLGHRPARLFEPAKPDGSRVILYLHGGAYIFGSPATHRTMTAYLARAAQCRVYSLDYRLAPEDPAPAAREDALAAVAALRELHPEAQLIISGDSAGGGLAMSCGLALRDQQQWQPAAYLLFCPWVDLELRGESIKRNREAEPLLSKDILAMAAEYYAAGQALADPALSPLQAELAGLAPIYVQAAGRDILLDDARQFVQKAKAAGVEAKLDVFAEHGHDFQLTADLSPEASMALVQAGAWVKATCSGLK